MTQILKYSKPITKIVKGDMLKVNGKKLEVDAHYVLIDYGDTKEMAIELFDPKSKEDEGDYQIRYFNDQVDKSLRFFILKTIMYEPIEIDRIEW